MTREMWALSVRIPGEDEAAAGAKAQAQAGAASREDQGLGRAMKQSGSGGIWPRQGIDEGRGLTLQPPNYRR